MDRHSLKALIMAILYAASIVRKSREGIAVGDGTVEDLADVIIDKAWN